MRTGPSGERLGLGERLLAARKRRGLRQLDVAREIGVCRETIARIEVDHIASEWTRARVRAWLEEQEGSAGAAAAAPAGPAAAERLARLRERRSAVRGLGGKRLRLLARLAVQRRAERALRAAAEARSRKRR